MRDTRGIVRSLVGLIAIACFALQAVAISKSSQPGKSPVHCVVWPFGDCEMVLASGYGAIVGEARAMNLDGALAILVPLTMWFGIIFTSHNPVFWMNVGEGKKKLSPGAWGYLLVYAALLLWAGSRLNP